MKIVVLEPIGITKKELEYYQTHFELHGHQLVHYEEKTQHESTLVERVKDADILIISNMKLPKSILAKCKKLKMISVAFTGIDHIDSVFCKEKNIRICNAAGYSNESVAELTFGMIISLFRSIVRNSAITRSGLDRQGYLGTEISGKTFGIIGTGAIGTRVASIANAFGCNVLAYSRTQKDLKNVQFVPKEDLLRQSDIVSLHVPLTKETKGLLGKNEFSLMKKNAILINTARGPVINNDDLAHALKNKEISGAAIDVYEYEPPLRKDHPLLDAPNTLLLPHIAYATNEAIAKRTKIVFENITAFLKNEPINVMI